MRDAKQVDGSFRDPSGFVFVEEGNYLSSSQSEIPTALRPADKQRIVRPADQPGSPSAAH